MKASLLIALLTTSTISASLAQFGGPDPYGGFPPIDSDDGSSGPTPPLNVPPRASFQAVEQENGCYLLEGDAFDLEGAPMTFEWTSVDQDTGEHKMLGTDLSIVACLPSGTYKIYLRATDDQGAFGRAEELIYVKAQRTAPDLQVESVAPSVLWPPNGKLWPIQLTYQVTHNPQTQVDVRIVSVTCNQVIGPDEIVQTGPTELYLAARRTSRLGERIYEVTLEATDEHGLSDRETITVRVPADSDSTVSTYTVQKPARR